MPISEYTIAGSIMSTRFLVNLVLNYPYDDTHEIYVDFGIYVDSHGERWLQIGSGPEAMPYDSIPEAIKQWSGWSATAGQPQTEDDGVWHMGGYPRRFVPAAELKRIYEHFELILLRDKLTSTLEEIGMFDDGRAGDLACAVLKEVGCWSKRLQRVDGKPTLFFPHRAHRGSDVEAFIKRERDAHEVIAPAGARALDRLLDDYRLHADCGVPLTEPTPSDGGGSQDPAAA